MDSGARILVAFVLIFIFVVFIGITFAVTIAVGFPFIQDTIIAGNSEHYTVSYGRGTSMYPYAKSGDALLIMAKTHPDFDIDPGDVIVFYRSDFNEDRETINYLIGHRVIGSTTQEGTFYYITRGDNDNTLDYVPDSDILGKIDRVITNNEWLTRGVIAYLV